jgi:hypothetical protein
VFVRGVRVYDEGQFAKDCWGREAISPNCPQRVEYVNGASNRRDRRTAEGGGSQS